MRRSAPIVALALLAAACSAHAPAGGPYPTAPRGDLVEDYHGTKVPAPYRWLEDDDAPATRAFVEAQNARTRSWLDAYAERPRIVERLTELWNYPKYSAPGKRGGRYFFSKNDGLQDQAVLYMQEGLDGAPAVILDPNSLSEDGTVALSGGAVSRDGKRLAWGVSVHGSDRQEFRIRDLDTGADLPETIRWCRFTSIAWTADGAGFFYNRFPEPGTVPPEDEANFSSVWWHAAGTDQAADVKVFDLPEEKELGFSPSVTEDGRSLILTVWHGTDPRYGLFFAPLEAGRIPGPADVVRLLEPGRAAFSLIEAVGERFVLLTDLDAPRGKLISVDPQGDEGGWEVLLPEHPSDVIEDVALVGDRLLVTWMRDAANRLTVHDVAGQQLREVALPGVGSVGGISGHPGDPEAFVTYTSFLAPPTILRMDVATGALETFRAPELRFDPSQYETSQVFVTSRDGTRVPMFLTHARGVEPTGDVPVLLYGYGGFNISLTPYFSLSRLLFLEAGGVYALVNLRGGAEYGEDWHRAGMLDKKQNVFDDFFAAAQWLVDAGWSRPERIGILGGSNGGLLVTACLLQRPELFGAAVAAVPVTDMLRYHRFTVGRYWVPEYGNAEADPEHFRFLHAYSPLHNVAAGVDYPPLLVTTADTDDRVVPSHSRKFVAAIQHADPGTDPILLRVEMKAGHGAGKPTSMKIEEAADIYGFLMAVFGMQLP